jgi:predicted lysophospholipase L1 biosynthesis ABC-type transport system permease subunit
VVLYESTRNAGDPTLPDLTTWEGYLGHFAAYAALAFCALMAVKRRSLATVLIVIIAAGIMGALLETYQSTLSAEMRRPSMAWQICLAPLRAPRR